MYTHTHTRRGRTGEKFCLRAGPPYTSAGARREPAGVGATPSYYEHQPIQNNLLCNSIIGIRAYNMDMQT